MVVAISAGTGMQTRSVLAQTNGSSFTSYAALAGKLSDNFVGPAIACEKLLGSEYSQFDIVAADPRSDGTCTVKGAFGKVAFRVDLPPSWNSRLYVHGNGGYGGESIHETFGLATRISALGHGFAAAFTNLGHDAQSFDGARWAYNDREAEINYSYRALHLATLAAKAIIGVYYGKAPEYSYFEGCSTGGGQGLKAALRFPDDFDGIAAGAPVFDFVGLQLYGWNNQVAIAQSALNQDKVARLGKIVLELFDAQDGLADGVIENPSSIDFVPSRDLVAYDGEFTEDELRTLDRLYRGPVYGGRRLYPGVPVGAESQGQKYRAGTFEPAAPASGWATRLMPR